MSFNYEQWEATMRRKHGLNWRQVMKERGAAGGRVEGEKGFARMEYALHRAASSKGGRVRRSR